MINVLIALLWAASVLITAYGTWLCLRKFGVRSPVVGRRKGRRPITILKPLKGLDNGLAENLKSFFRLSYPDFEILFCVAEESDPASDVVKRLIRQYPKVKARLLTGDSQEVPNPKVDNLLKGYDAAANDWILISDSNVRVPRDSLRRLAARIDDRLGVLTSVVAGIGARSPGGRLESIFLRTFYARWMVTTGELGHACVVGKSMLFNRRVADRFGGIRALGRYLAEDFMMGKAMGYLGYRVEIANEPVYQHIGDYHFLDFWRRHIRWGRIRKAQAPLAFLFEPTVSAVGSGILGAVGLNALFGWSPWTFFAWHLGLWAFADLLIAARLCFKSPWELKIYWPFVWLLREILHLPLWIHTLMGNSVYWRGRTLKLHWGGLLAKTPSPSSGVLPRAGIRLTGTIRPATGGSGKLKVA